MFSWICIPILKAQTYLATEEQWTYADDLRSMNSDGIAALSKESWSIALLCLLKNVIPHD